MDDFSVIVSEGDMGREKGLFGRRNLRRVLDDVPAGRQRVLLNENGQALLDSSTATAGQKYWGAASVRRWALVDVSTKTLEYKIPLSDAANRVDMIATVTLSVNVIDPAHVVTTQMRSVKHRLLPCVASFLSTSTRDATDQTLDRNVDRTVTIRRTLTGVQQGLGSAETLRSLHDVLQSQISWLEARPITIGIELDAATKRHYDELVTASREEDLAKISQNAEIARRGAWKEVFNENDLSDPVKRSVFRLTADPSAENITAVIQEISNDEAARLTAVVPLLEKLLDTWDPGSREALVQAVLTTLNNAGVRVNPATDGPALGGRAGSANLASPDPRSELSAAADDEPSDNVVKADVLESTTEIDNPDHKNWKP